MGRGVLTRRKNIVDEKQISYLDLSRMNNEDIELFQSASRTQPIALPSEQQKKNLEGLLLEYVLDLK